MRYRKSRASYPDGVLAIYDNGGKSADRYTVVYTPDEMPVLDSSRTETWFGYVAMSEAPFWPQGVCTHGALQFRPIRRSGEKCINLNELPADCQKVVAQDLMCVE